MIPFEAAETHNAFQWAGQSPKLPLPVGDLIHGSLGPQMQSGSVQPFLYGSQTWPTERYTDRQTMLLCL